MDIKVIGTLFHFGQETGEVKYTTSGKAYCRFSISEETKRGSREYVSHQATAWGDLAEAFAGIPSKTLVRVNGFAAKARCWDGKNGHQCSIQFSVSDRDPSETWAGGRADEGGHWAEIGAEDDPDYEDGPFAQDPYSTDFDDLPF